MDWDPRTIALTEMPRMKCKEQDWQRVKHGGGCKNEVGDFETGAEEGTGTREPKERALFGQGRDLTHMDLITHPASVRNRNKVLRANIGLAKKLTWVRWKNSNKILAQPIVWLLFSEHRVGMYGLPALQLMEHVTGSGRTGNVMYHL